jgi:hypothetical protein
MQSQIIQKYKGLVQAQESERLAILEKYSGSANVILSKIDGLKKQRRSYEDQIISRRKSADQQIAGIINQEKQSLGQNAAAANAQIETLQREKSDLRAKEANDIAAIRRTTERELAECFVTCDSIRNKSSEEISAARTNTNRAIAQVESNIRSLRESSIGQTGRSSGLINKVRASVDQQIKKIQDQIDSIDRSIVKNQRAAERAKGTRTAADKKALEVISREIKQLNHDKTRELQAARARYDQRTDLVDSATSRAAGNQDRIAALRESLSPLCAEFNAGVLSNQVYRLALQISTIDDACELTQKELSTTQFLWFGSLALVVSALGTALAFAGLVIRYDRRKPIIKEVTVERTVEKIVEITKEIPVEKIVFRDVPVEIIQKELVHVPLFTQNISDIKTDG